jgi:large subunit ribosomal protein L31
MKNEIHPQYYDTTVHCVGCGSSFVTGSTVPEIRVNVCSVCHPFYSGKQKLVDAEGRVDRFKKKYAKFGTEAKA